MVTTELVKTVSVNVTTVTLVISVKLTMYVATKNVILVPANLLPGNVNVIHVIPVMTV